MTTIAACSVEGNEVKSFIFETGELKDPLEKVKFSAWLRVLLGREEPPAGEFEAWKEARGQGRAAGAPAPNLKSAATDLV